MSKRTSFLNPQNIQLLTKRIFRIHIDGGGESDPDEIRALIADLVQNWVELDEFDRYESLIHDPISELEHINNMFIQRHRFSFSKGAEKHTITPTYLMRPEDYGKLDRDNDNNNDKVVSNGNYRYNNTIPLYQRSGHNRQYDTSNDGLYYESKEGIMNQRYDMDAIDQVVDEPYKQIDDGHVPYYGQSDGIDRTAMVGTGWKQDP